MTEANFSDRPANLPTRRQRLLRWITRVCFWFPVVFVAGITVYGCQRGYTMGLTGNDCIVLYLVFFNILFVLFVLNYGIMTFRRPGSPSDYPLVRATSEGEPLGWRRQENSKNGKVFVLPVLPDRYCGICDYPKPDRTHHCSICERCILKMDHHCPWFNNCVGYRNYKFFLLSLFYAFLMTVFIFTTLLQQLIWELTADKTTGTSIQFLVICVLALLFAISSAVLLFYHAYLLAINMTTLEHLDDRRHHPDDHSNHHHPYDIGVWRNIKQVLGENVLVWFIPWPVDASQHGLIYPTNQHGIINPTNQHGIIYPTSNSSTVMTPTELV